MAVEAEFLSAAYKRKLQLLMAVIFLAKLSVSQCVTVFPYKNDFETNTTGWTTGGTASDWAWGTPAKSLINTAASGTKCWITGGLNKTSYNNGELAWLQSPCFNFTSIVHPYIAFMVFWETEFNFDGAVLEYSTNNGATWVRAGGINDAKNCLNGNWFNTASVRYANNGNGWSGSVQGGGSGCGAGGGSTKWVLANHTFPALAGQANVRFRFLFGAGTSCNGYNGFAVDDFLVSEAPPNQAAFSFNCVNGNTVNFINSSASCPTYLWNFGDPGSGAANTSSLANPSHVYSNAGTFNVTLTASGPDNAPSTITQTVTVVDLNTQIIAQPACNGDKNGSAMVTASPNAATLIYSWNSTPVQNSATANNLGAGTYIVTVSGTGVCTAQDNITIVDPPKISNTITTTQPGCQNNDGVISLNTTGGAGPYTYTWSPNTNSSNTATGLGTATYSIIVKDQNNCSVTEQVVLNSGTALIANVLSKQDITCFGNKNGSIFIGVNGGFPPYDLSWAPYGGNQQQAQNLGPGTYTLTIKDQKGCILTASATIIEPAQLSSTISKTDAVCNNNNGSATANITGGVQPYTYSWAPGGFSTAGITNLAANTYNLTATDNNGCKVSDVVTISNGAAAINLQIVNTPAVCHATNTGTAAVTASGGTAPYTYQWNNGETSSSISNLLPGTYSVTVKDATGCSGTATTVITEPPTMGITMQTTDASCNGGLGSVSTVITGGTPAYAYSWTPAAANTAGIAAPAGTYSVTVTDAKGCRATNSATILEPNAISFEVATDAATCGLANGAAYFSQAPAGGSAPLTSTWSPGNIVANRIDNKAVGNYTVTVRDAAGCFVTKGFNISTNHEGPVALMLTTTDAKCFGSSTGSATAVASGGNDITIGNTGYTYNWSNGATGSTAHNLAAGTYNVVAKSNSSGCIHNGTVTIKQTPLMTVSTSPTNPACFGGTGNISSTVTGGAGSNTYLWTPGNMTTANISNVTAGTYQLTVTDMGGCSMQSSAIVTEPPLLSSSLQTEQPSCSVSGGTIAVIAAGGSQPYNYAWNPNISSNQTITNLAAGTYSVTITDKNGCSTQNSAVINSFNSITTQISSTDIPCFGQNTGSASIAVSGGQSPYSITWSTGANSMAIQNLAAGNYSVIVRDASNCVVTKNFSILQPPKINIQLTVTAAICNSASGSINSVVSGGVANYQYAWLPGGASQPQLSQVLPGNYSLSITDQNGCTVTANATVSNSNPLQITLGADTALCFGSNETLQLSPGNFLSYRWQDGSTAATYTVSKEGVYHVMVTDQRGCLASDSILIKNDCGEIYFPTAFTPNGDGNNDLFGPLGNLSILKDFQLVVFNRWGQRVFVSNNPFVKWDGRMAGSDIITGTYVWHARYSSVYGTNQIQKGTVILVR